jgi:hypothetical protein
MRSRSAILTVSLLAATCSWGDCPDGSREGTPAERDFHSKVLRAMAELFPAAPEGFKQPPPPVIRDGGLSLCNGTPLGGFRMNLRMVYERAASVREKQTPEYAPIPELEKQMEALKVLPPEAKAKYDEIKKQYDAVYAPYRAATKANNKEEAARLRKDVDATYDKMRKVEEDHRRAMLPKSNEIQGEINKVRAAIRAKYQDPVTISIVVNDELKKLEGGGWELGKMTKPAVKVQRVIYEIKGPEQEVEKFKAAVDQAKLKALIDLK